MKFVFDTDILSTFSKIDRLDLLEKVFRKNELLVPVSVVRELKASKSEETRSVADSDLFVHRELKDSESNFKKELQNKRILGCGEIDCIAICKVEESVLVSNDKKAIKVAESYDISVIDLETILFSLKDILSNDEVKNIIEEIESKDKVIVVNKDKILQ